MCASVSSTALICGTQLIFETQTVGEEGAAGPVTAIGRDAAALVHVLACKYEVSR